jgi:hypothetical protein
MSELAYRNGFSFMIGAGIGFGLSNSFKMLDGADKLPEKMTYSNSYPIGAAALTETITNYMEIVSEESVFDALSDDPGFMAGAALGVYLGEKYHETASYSSELEKLYEENGLEEVWNDLEY